RSDCFLDGVCAGVPDFCQPASARCIFRIVISSDADELSSLADSVGPELDGHLREILVAGDFVCPVHAEQSVNFAGPAIVENRFRAGHGDKTAAATNELRVIDSGPLGGD